ncbi:unnamed protein product [Rangifer tarandus platyrhynchus]|uniref:Uncharacterized protein n=1 Tax=Rangifer tarandus platyrhynchus TaxID=3082113 RepID=A0ABN8XM65_RANTA|nr:unnamed protein product [Rangifer tarandus platyrhynchus]
MGSQGPGCAPPMPEGGSEDRGPRSAAGPNQTPPGPRGPEPRTGVGGGGGGADRGRAWRGPGREGAETSAPLTPTPSPGMHARPAARGPGNTPGPRAGPGLLARVACVRGRGGFGRAAGPGRRAPWKGAAGWLDTAHQSEKEAQCRVFKCAWRQPPPSKIIPP